MQINYFLLSGERWCFYQLHLAYRHLQVVFCSDATIKELAKQRIISHNSVDFKPSIMERVVHFIVAAIEATLFFVPVVALADRFFGNLDTEKPQLSPPEFPTTLIQNTTKPNIEASSQDDHGVFGVSNAAKLVSINPNIKNRKDFLTKTNWKNETLPPVIGKSSIVPDGMVEKLMRAKKRLALATKYVRGDSITNMEGAIHTFLVPVAHIKMLGDYWWSGTHDITRFLPGFARNVILSATIQPDFEFDSVMMKICALEKAIIEGEPLSEYTEFPTANAKRDDAFRKAYDLKLRKHLIYHLTAQRRLPALSECHPVSRVETIKLLEKLIRTEEASGTSLQDKYVYLQGRAISLEVLFNVYVEQLKVEFKILDHSVANPYVYTIDSPSIFAAAIGRESGVEVLNRLQALAFKKLLQDAGFAQKLHLIGCNDYADKTLTSLLKGICARRGVQVVPKASLFQGPQATYSGPNGFALVLHNNSDGFGDNIGNEGPSSMDGVFGSYSNAACCLHLKREDLVSQIIPVY